MIIEITDNKTTGEIGKEFSDYFPFLKIEFFTEPHHWQEPSALKHILPPDKKIRDIRKRHNPGAIEIHLWQKTGIVEQEFSRSFGLNVQIFRKHGSEWIQAAGTDELILEDQNELGRSASQNMLHGTDRKFENEKLL
jgi:hypothetical protein